MNRDVEALIDQIDIDEHLGHYQKLTYSQRARIMGGLFSFSRSVKHAPSVVESMRKRAEKKFTPAMCRKFLKKISSVGR